jgi:hypothetical protein
MPWPPTSLRSKFQLRLRFQSDLFTALALILFITSTSFASDVPVRYPEGVLTGFLVLRNISGKRIADGDLAQTLQGDRVTLHLAFKFLDGSSYDEVTVLTQQGSFRLLSDHIVQKGPSFDPEMDASIDVAAGKVSVHSMDKKGKKEQYDESMSLPPDLANGILFTLLKNIDPHAATTNVPYVALTPKPRLVQFEIAAQNEQTVSAGSHRYPALHFLLKIEIGGITGVVAKVVGKQPPDSDAWTLKSDAPVFLAMQGPLYSGGPIWRIELAAPTPPRMTVPSAKSKK